MHHGFRGCLEGHDFVTSLLDGRTILVLEDDYLSALDLSETLADLGAVIAGPVGRLVQAQELARSVPLDAAILDVNVGRVNSYPVARELVAKAVPFVFLTGYSRENIDSEFAQIPCLAKPFVREELESALKAIFDL